MKLLKIAFATALLALFVSGQSQRREVEKASVVLVIATNPIFPNGMIVTNNLPDAQAEAKALTSLDPVCQAVPDLCSARFAATVYRIVYSNGKESTL